MVVLGGNSYPVMCIGKTASLNILQGMEGDTDGSILIVSDVDADS